ncbi:serine hydrolase domain-containing protein [Dissulfurirhabdus thermomarina]|uniref:serine hydrolase domain-containing protein n=1 Tax=Dissulfurirhabdus thermomarina TaxID=1765737 RepID=UPI0024845944|nr:serine hydrolase domain-containing protein [Dissulfurirhabdus thermomarina]
MRGEGVAPGGVLTAAVGGETVLEAPFGRFAYAPWSPRVRAETWWDLASLTKPLATALAVLVLVGRGRLTLEAELGAVLDGVSADKAAITLRQLLAHCGGLAAHRPYAEAVARLAPAERAAEVRRLLLAEPLAAAPGSVEIYSDLGFILLGWVVEAVTGRAFPEAVADLVLAPLGASGLGFAADVPPGGAAPTGWCPLRGRLLQGEVHDANAWALGGAAGHAGLFGTAAGVRRLLLRLLELAAGRRVHPDLPADLVREAFRRQDLVPGGTRALGFDTPSAEGSSAGTRLSRESAGHLGFTGTSFWMDLDREVVVVLLTNRTFPDASPASQEGLRRWRPRLHDLVLEVFQP